MTRSLPSFVTIVALFIGLSAAKAHADAASDRAVIADSLSKMAVVAHQLGKAAQGSDDRAVRKKFAPVANDIGDDLDALARRAGKADVEISVIVKGMAPIEKDATQLVDLADEAEDKAERKKLRADASQLQATISAAKKLIEQIGNKKEEAKKAPAGPTAMADAAFSQLVSTVRSASFDDDKVAVVRDAAKLNWFTSNQVATLLGLLAFDEGKIEAAVAAWPHLVDPANSFVIYKKLAFDSSREELRKRVSR